MPQRVMITAGGSGIGLAIARAFSDRGANVHVCDADESALADATKSHPQFIATHLDVTDEDAVGAWFDSALSELNGLDVLVNNAGTKGPTGYVEELELDDWRDCLKVCLDAQFLCAKRAVPVMKGSTPAVSSTSHRPPACLAMACAHPMLRLNGPSSASPSRLRLSSAPLVYASTRFVQAP